MEIKMKYQYTYFIYPYVVKEQDFSKYLYHLLNNKNCKLKIFDKNKDAELYSYMLPQIRNYMFWSFEFSKKRIDKLSEIDNKMQAILLEKYPCTIFEYEINKDIQGKAGKEDGIFFSIRKVEMICFNTGICFLCMKTMLDENSNLSDLYNFNYKFRDIESSTNDLKSFDNIKIQTDTFQDIKGIQAFIKKIIGNNNRAKSLNIDTERFITYSYACIGQEYWNEDTNAELLNKEFYKLINIEPANHFVEYNDIDLKNIYDSKYTKIGTTRISTGLLTSDINTDNYTKLPEKYEKEYLYNYIFEWYKKIYLQKTNKELSENSDMQYARKKFINFTKNIWINDITNDNIGLQLSENWEEKLELNDMFIDTKRKYYILYKNINIEKIMNSNKWIAIILIILVIINIINCIHIFGS